MWWLDPGKEVLNILFNRVLAPYVENLDMNQVNYGIGQGQLTLRQLRLKKGALDKFRLPVDVIEGHLGKFTLSLHWMNLGNQPVEILIEDVYLLVVPSSESSYDAEEEDRRAQAAKFERLQNAELLHMQGQAEQGMVFSMHAREKTLNTGVESPQQQGLLSSLINKVINNLQVTVKNIHVRYEDKLSVPGHPFAAGVTLAGFTVVSVNDRWLPAFIDSTAGIIHKLAKMESLAVYFDTDAASLAGLSYQEFVKKFTELINHGENSTDHQFVLKPVSGEGRVKINNKSTKDIPRFDVQLLFNEIGVLLDDNQYRDAISLVDMYHFYTRQHQYHKFRPAVEDLEESQPRAFWKFASTAILDEVHQKRRQWTWNYFKERRDDRHRYVELFKNKQLGPLSPTDTTMLEALERKLSYEDLRFYRSIARSQLKKDLAAQRKLDEEKKKQQTQSRSSWTGWLWGSSGSSASEATAEESPFSGEMTDEQRKQLYEILDYDEKAALASSFETPRDALQLRAAASLQRGSLALKTDPHGRNTEILSVLFNRFQADFIQRPDNFETSLSLTSFSVHDGTTKNTVYPRIVQVQDEDTVRTADMSIQPVDPFLYLKFEHNPLDHRADSALTVRMRNMEVVYHRGYIEAVYKFFKPPASQLESVEALLDAAGETLEGIRRETRAGLEYALETHKTVDIQMDINTPIIIIPENITTKDCKHLIIDAGHIAIESELADKKAVQEISSKRKQQYSDEDYRRLESLMYDKLTVRLEAAQFVIGTDLEASRKALTSDEHDELHLLERININLQVQNSIVPSAHSLARFKLSGHLPNLQINLSDAKYKSLMRLIDVSIPKFDNDSNAPRRPALEKAKSGAGAFRLPSGIFGSHDPDYNIDSDTEDEKRADKSAEADDNKFFEAQPGAVETLEMLQHIVEVDFRVDNLRASLYKSHEGVERELGNLTLEQFAMSFAMAKFTMAVDLSLRSLSMHVVQTGKESIKFISSASADLSEHLLAVKYNRVQPQSPQFTTVYEGIDQSVDIMVTTVIVRAAPEPVIALYDFIMTTFVPQDSAPNAIDSPSRGEDAGEMTNTSNSSPTQRIRVLVKLAGVQVIVINEDVQVATLAMSTGDASIMLHASTMQVNCRLGSLSLIDDSELRTAIPGYKQILSIEGDNFADFRYQTFDPSDQENYKGVKSSVYLATGSLRVHYLEESLHQLYVFLMRLAKLKGLYDAATQAAAQSVSEIERMQFDISIKSPIIVFPTDVERSLDALVLRLGELNAHNSFQGPTDKINASLRGISLSSTLSRDGQPQTLKMVENIDATADVTQVAGVDRTRDLTRPDTAVNVTISDVKLHLTQVQYGLLMELSKSIPRVLAVPFTDASEESTLELEKQIAVSSDSAVDLQPEVQANSSGSRSWPTLDVLITLEVVKLHLYDESASSEQSLKEHGIARLALNSCTLRGKTLSDGATEAEVILKSFTMSNTRPGNTKFREIIPAAQHNRNQVMILFTSTGGHDNLSIAVITVDSPQVIFAVDPIIGLLEFFTSALDAERPASQEVIGEESDNVVTVAQAPSTIDFRLDLHDVSVSVLENDTDVNTRAIRLNIRKLFLSQQGILALSVEHLGMSLTRMGKDADTVRFLDDVDFTFSLDSRFTATHQTTTIEMTSQPIVFRASYRDMNLITTIVNRAIELYTESAQKHSKTNVPDSDALVPARSVYGISTSRKTTRAATRSRPVGSANVVLTKEQLRASCEGFRLILIGDLHEQPMLHLKVKPFVMTAKDWSAELQATTTLAVHISYWNLTNSHWEPLIDPWTFTASIVKDSTSGGLVVAFFAKERLDLNLSMTFVELALATAKMFGQEGERVLRKARGSYAPYKIRNRTGCSISVWADADGSTTAQASAMTEIPHDKTIDWRFDDWKTMREHVSSTTHNSIGVQFIGKQWDQVRSIPVDREGEFAFTLRPRTDKLAHRIVCDVVVEDNVKIVTIRSTYRVENYTLYPLEITLVDELGRPVHALEKIAPGQDYTLPIEGIGQNRLKIQPDQGFGYKPSPAIRWEDLISRRSFAVRCPHTDPQEAAFRFQAWVDTDVKEAVTRKYPKISLKLRAPVELENLLPYNIEYRIYDKNTDQNWRSYLRKGGVMPVHSVELGHMVLLNVTVQDAVFKPSDFSIINTDGSADFDIENRLTLRDEKDRKLDLGLNYVRYPDSGGCFKVQIYCPYLIVNKTGLPFSVRPWRANRIGSPQDVAGDLRPVLSHPNAQGKDFSFKFGQSMWSQAIGLEAPAAETRLVIPSESRSNDEIHVGLTWSEGLGKYKLTKVITLAPRFILRNNTSEDICYREHAATPRDRGILEPGKRTPMHFMRQGDAKLLTLAFAGINAQWSAPINLEDIGRVHFRLVSPGTGHVHLIRAEMKLGGSTIFVVISQAEEWPFTVENDSDYAFTVYQRDLDHPEGPTGSRTVPAYKIASKSIFNYAWDFPASREKKLVLDVYGAGIRRALDILEIGALVPFRFSTGQGTRIVSLDVRAEGSKQVLRISNYNAQVSLYKPTSRRAGSVTQLDVAATTGSQEGFEAVQEEVSSSLAINVDFEGIGLSLVNRKAVEVVYMSVNSLKFEYTNSPVAQAVNIVCGSLQIDNQLHDALFPVVLQPTPISKDSSTVASPPTLQGSVIWLKDEAHGVTFVKYCSILVQALTVQADEDFLYALFDLTKIKGAPWDEVQEDVLIAQPDEVIEPEDTAEGQELYFEVLELQPIQLAISFMRTERVSSDEQLAIRNPFAVVLNAITMAVGNINEAPLEMNALAIKDMRLRLPELQSRIMYHYRQEVLRQLYRILGSADFIGNPVGLFTNVSSGVADIFYEPFNGAVMHGNQELGIGIAKGAASFVKKTVFGVSDSVTKFTSSVGKGLSAATFDSEYQMRRRMTQRRNKPRHAIYGVAAGAEAFASSLASGVEGVVLKPIEGAENDGARGFFKGIGKGLVGAVTKPVIGVFDLASNVSEGIRNTTTVFDNPARDRVRSPRLVPADGVLVPFSQREALGQYWMKDLENGAYRKENYVAHINLPGGDNVVLLTTSRVISFASSRLRVDWQLPFTQVQGVTIEDTGIRFAHKGGKEHDRFVYIPDKASQTWFFGQVASVVKAFNAQRRIDS
ncbi:uncharacterized protein PHACADRAFT_156217 [Phanerochaete carnosa HHB-10118-sp]|uniref:Vacuolar protein sorting-associated protein n=1 Tax=Phanerochaete carnosa (strain HHB-10118-sp) TaxID=650164 RepID=K5VDJ3_PHACS|nr:uncharacterized protein PHACADRAFT_156217 [Phanerochaete carnosa HHB-10118-sp]EKM61051.1 hypothetical protein PHACADRAFT_156217 [Phanerochaete carnosa HHB-10118-sp]